MCRIFQGTATALAATAILGVSSQAGADIDVSGQLTIATDYMFQGVSQTMSGTALQGELGFEVDNGWYGYAWASNVDFSDSNSEDDGASLEVNLQAGYAHSVTDRLSVTLGTTAYVFPGTKSGFDYDYGELHGALSVDDQHGLTIGYSDNVFGSGATGIFYEGRTGIDLTQQLHLGVELGHYDLEDAYDFSYNYAVLSLAGNLESLGWQLSYFTTSEEIEKISYESTVSDRLVLALTLVF